MASSSTAPHFGGWDGGQLLEGLIFWGEGRWLKRCSGTAAAGGDGEGLKPSPCGREGLTRVLAGLNPTSKSVCFLGHDTHL